MSSQTITAQDLQTIGSLPGQIESLQKKLQELAAKLERVFGARSETTIIPVQALEDSSLEVMKMFYLSIEEAEDSFIATFFDAHLSSSGKTVFEAVDNLKDMISATFKRLSQVPGDKLGPVPRRQIAVLRELIREHEPSDD